MLSSDPGLIKKLRIASGQSRLIVNAPEGYAFLAAENQPRTNPVGEKLDFGLLFVTSVAVLEKSFPGFAAQIKFDGILWVAYPKKSSGAAADINRDAGWEVVFQAGFRPVTQISIDSTWSALRFRPAGQVGK